MNRRVGYGIAVVVGLLAAYYAAPIFVGVISLGEICPYSPLGTSLCAHDTSAPSASRTGPEPVAGKLCKEDGVRYAGTTAQGAEVCLTLSPDGSELIETGFSFVRASGCPDEAAGTVHSDYPGTVDPSGRVVNPDGLTATIEGATASGVFADPTICPGKKFTWSARRAP